MANEPLTLDSLVTLGALDTFVAPTGSFDLNAAWEHRYRIWLVDQSDVGFLRLAHSATAPGGPGVLTVEQSVNQSPGAVHKTNAELNFVADALATPGSWQVGSVVDDLNSQPIDRVGIQKSAVVTGGEIHVTIGTHTFIRTAPATFTSNWSLFDAVQRLPGSSTTPLDFDLLEELDLLKPGQRLSYTESRSLVVNGQTLSLVGYHMIGNGILPYEFWVDDQGQLLFAFSGIRAYILDLRPPKSEVFRETWDAATIPQTFAKGSSGTVAGADKAWSYTVGTNAGPLAMVEETPGGSRRLEGAGGGGASPNQGVFTSHDVSVDFDAVGSVTIKAAVTLNQIGTTATGTWTLWIALRDSNPSMTGFCIYFNARTDQQAMSAHVYLNGVKTTVSLGGAGEQEAGETYYITATFASSGANTVVTYQVEKASEGNLIPPGTKTIAAALPAGTTLSAVELTFNQKVACAVDNVVVEA